MNFLAHTYLSGTTSDVIIGNFIADFVKGNAGIKLFHPGIQKGILLHRRIDNFTDQDKQLSEIRKKLHPHFHKYSGIALDIFFDYFLAKDWHLFSDTSLHDFSSDFFKLTETHMELMPEPAQHVLQVMKQQDWFGNYRHSEGIHLTFQRYSKRISYPPLENAAHFLIDNESMLSYGFNEFFPRLADDCKLFLKNINE